MYHLLLINFFFLFKFKSCFSILLFTANYKANKHYISKEASIEGKAFV